MPIQTGNYEKRINQAKEYLTKGFMNKTQQKECLTIINNAFEDKASTLQNKILDELRAYREKYGIENERLNDLYYGVPSYASQLSDKVILKYQGYEELADLINVKKFYDEVKSIEVVKKVESVADKKQKVYSTKLKMMDRSNITDENAYMTSINKIVLSADKILTPLYDLEAEKLIKILNYPKDILDKKFQSDNFKNFYNTFIKGKTEEQLKSALDEEKNLVLLDIKFKAMEKLNFNIKSIKLNTFSPMKKSWLINGNKLFEIEIIQAGGYNIQRLHFRTLVKLKNI